MLGWRGKESLPAHATVALNCAPASRRYTGPHWGRFFNIILNLAISQLEGKELSPDEQMRVAANTALPPKPTALPDLILFGE